MNHSAEPPQSIKPLGEGLRALFSSYTRAHGKFLIPRAGSEGAKVRGKHRTVIGPASDADWYEHLSGGRESLGLVPLLDDGDNVRWAAVDIDDNNIDHRAIARQIRELRLPLWTCRSKSGGAHLYMFLENPMPAVQVVQALNNWSAALGYPGVEIFPKQTRRGTNDAGEPLPGNWINLPYCGAERSTRYCVDENGALLPEEFVSRAHNSRANNSDLNVRCPAQHRTQGSSPTPKAAEGRNGFLYSVGCRLRAAGFDEEQMRKELAELNASAQVENHPNFAAGPLDARELNGIVEQALKQPSGERSGTTESVAKLNHHHAVVMVRGKCSVLNEDYDPTTGFLNISFSTPANFKERYSNQRVQVGDRSIALGRFWFEHPGRREYQAIVFEPGKEIPGVYNLWRGFSVQPKSGDCGLYLDHIRQQICHDDDDLYNYIIAWLADVVQRPRRRTGVALALVGEQGSGKGVFISEFGKLFGQHFIHIAQTRHLTSHFNGHLKDKLVVFADESFWAGDKKSEGVLRALVTEDTLQIEMKGKDVLTMRNYIHLMVATNEVWAVPAGNKERRFLTLQVSNARLQDRPYFQALTELMENGGRAALLDHLMNVDLSGIDLGKLPRTQATTDQKIQSAPPIRKWWLDRLMAGSILVDGSKWEESVATHRVFEELRLYLKDLGYRYRPADAEIGMILHKLVPGLEKRRPASPQGREQRYYFPTLTQCRSAYDRFSDSENDWVS